MAISGSFGGTGGTSTNLLGGTTASKLFTGQPAPYLPQIMQPLPDPTKLFAQYQSMFPQPAANNQYLTQMQQAWNGIPQVPLIRAPQVAPVQIAIPEGSYDAYREALYNAQFMPVQRALEQREQIAGAALSDQLAQAGLSDSGVGIGQQQRQGREFSEQTGAASAAISESATASAEQARFAIMSQQANIDIQRSLANANLDFGAQQANARNILERGVAEGQSLIAALGLDANRADAYRNGFISFLNGQTQAALGQSEIARAALADIFNAVLRQAALDQTTEQRLAPTQLAQGPGFGALVPGFAQQPLAGLGPGGAGTFTGYAPGVLPLGYAPAGGFPQGPPPGLPSGGGGGGDSMGTILDNLRKAQALNTSINNPPPPDNA